MEFLKLQPFYLSTYFMRLRNIPLDNKSKNDCFTSSHTHKLKNIIFSLSTDKIPQARLNIPSSSNIPSA
jgi:hypothetical protein